MDAMSFAYLAIPSQDQPCRYCTHYAGVAWGDPSVAWCGRETRRVVSQPERGCAFYLRLTGVDDDLPPPPRDGARDDGAWTFDVPPAAPHPHPHPRSPMPIPMQAGTASRALERA
jgi:hypothetical protein